MKTKLLLAALTGIAATSGLTAQDKPKQDALTWRLQLLHKDNNEGAAVGDIDGDGVLDVVAGEFWYPGPDYKQLPLRKLLPFGKDYLQNNSDHLYDMNGDGLLDVVSGAFTLPVVNWFENPGPGNYDKTPWKVHEWVNTGIEHNEATYLHDIDGDGTPEWFTNSWNKNAPMLIFRLVKDADGKVTAEKHVVAEQGNGHGMGFGDINGDGHEDIIFLQGWYECPAEGPFSGPWKWHADFDLPHASCPILVVDLNGDGKNDIIWADGHNYGIYWHEQQEPQSDGTTTWRQHLIDKKFSKGHCIAWADIDQDGQAELISGKRYRAHSGSDPGANDNITVHYYKYDPSSNTWAKKLISDAPAGEGPGVGLQINLADLNGDNWLDIVVPGKSGTYIIWNEGKK